MAEKTYYITDFPNDKINAAILTEEVGDAGISIPLASINQEGGEPPTVTFIFTGTFAGGDEALLDAVVAAHQGDDFTILPVKTTSEAEGSDDSGSEILKASLEDILPSPGTYLVMWYMEIATTSNTGTSAARGLLYVTKNGNSAIERAVSHNAENQFKGMSGTFIITITAGDEYTLELKYERIGTSGNAARAQRARLAMVRIGQ